MEDLLTDGSGEVTAVTERRPDPAALPADAGSCPQLNTPLLPASLPPAANARATLTVLTGLQAGRLVAVDGAPVTIGRGPGADLVVHEAGVSRLHARVARLPRGAFYVEDLGSSKGTFVGAARVGVSLLHQVDLLQLGPQLRVRFAIVDSVEDSLYRQLYDFSTHDPLTHPFNRKYLSRARCASGDVAVLMIDVDALKTVNDRFGHLAGDRALCTVAARIKRVLRVEDVLARHGGDEFVVLVSGTDRADAIRLAERVRRAVEGLRMGARGREVAITTSIGVASLAELAASDEPVTALVAMADARMHGAKASGGNRVFADCVTPPAATAIRDAE
jgi:two-component system cell cycle response regulator